MFLRPSDHSSPLLMATAAYDKAFALLEQSFKDSSFLEAYQSLPSRLGTERADSPSDPSGSDDSDTSSEDSMHVGYGNKGAPQIGLVRTASALPPTPPSFVRETNPINAPLVPLPAQQSGVSTPLQQQAPPTPDPTPPHTREKDALAPRPNLPHYPSSRAESFFTAREDQSQASARTSQLSLPLRTESISRGLDTSAPTRTGGLRLGRADDIQEDDLGSEEATPTQEKQNSFDVSAVQYMTQEDVDKEGSSSGREDPNLLRNVTMRKKRAHKPDQQTTLRQEVVRHRNSDTARMPQSEDSTESPSTVKDGENLDWPEIANDFLYRHMRNEKSKRLSGVSTTSTVVEAVVLSGPALRKPTLRRVSKHDTLRDDVPSKRNSLDSVNAVQHRLRHRKSPLPGHLMDGNLDNVRSVSNPEARHRDKIPVIVVPERRSSLPQDPVGFPNKTHLLTFQQNRLYHTKQHVSLVQDYKDGERRSSLEQLAVRERSWLVGSVPDPLRLHPRPQLRHVSAPEYMNNESAKTPSSSKDAFRRINGTSPNLDFSPLHSPKQGWKRHSLDAELASPERDQPIQRSRPSTGRSQASEKLTDRRRSSLKQSSASTQGVFDYASQPSPHKYADWKDARYLHPAATPASMSQVSDRTDSMELNEAKAVNIYPHENKSLLLIQHVAKKRAAAQNGFEPNPVDELATPESEGPPTERQSSLPIFTAIVDEPQTPRATEVPWSVDSPLRNPRQAPQPPRLPAINFIPATPVNGGDKDPSPEPPATQRTSLERPQSFVEKARRYSESLIQPFLPRSLRNSSSHERPEGADDRNTTLHPFWRPRGFWDDFDSESDDGYDEPLPSGGDTSDIFSDEEDNQRNRIWLPRKMSIRMRGFRGTGGFMLGNSLGISRHGTNSRRPYVVRDADNGNTGIARILRKRKSRDLLMTAAQSTESLKRLAQRGGVRKHKFWIWTGDDWAVVKDRIRKRKEEKNERERERLRRELKRSIGSPLSLHA